MILFIKKRNPWDRSTDMDLQALKEIYGEDQVFVVDLLNPVQEQKTRYIAYGKYRGPIDRILRSIQGNVAFISNEIINDICQIIVREQIKLVFSEESDLGNLMKKIKQENPDVRIICQYRDISGQLFAQRRKKASWRKPYYKLIETTITIRQERLNQKYVDENWVFHDADSDRFQNLYGQIPDAIIPLSLEPPHLSESDFQLNKSAEDNKNILFICSTYNVNIDGFMWFYRNIIGKLQDRFHLKIVGRGSNSLKKYIKHNNIEIIGPVDSVDSYYREADIVITPVFDGGGMKVKDVEAVSYAKCILSTKESFHGIWENAPETIKNRMLYCSDDAEEWVRILNKLFYSEIRKHDREEYEWFCSKYSYEAHLKGISQILNQKPDLLPY